MAVTQQQITDAVSQYLACVSVAGRKTPGDPFYAAARGVAEAERDALVLLIRQFGPPDPDMVARPTTGTPRGAVPVGADFEQAAAGEKASAPGVSRMSARVFVPPADDFVHGGPRTWDGHRIAALIAWMTKLGPVAIPVLEALLAVLAPQWAVIIDPILGRLRAEKAAAHAAH